MLPSLLNNPSGARSSNPMQMHQQQHPKQSFTHGGVPGPGVMPNPHLPPFGINRPPNSGMGPSPVPYPPNSHGGGGGYNGPSSSNPNHGSVKMSQSQQMAISQSNSSASLQVSSEFLNLLSSRIGIGISREVEICHNLRIKYLIS
jgi:hypothetical protein